MSKVHGGWLVAKTLHELGVREIFSLSGGHINPIYDACVDFNIRIIDTHHEQGAAMAADAYGRVKRQPGVCLVTAVAHLRERPSYCWSRSSSYSVS